MSAANFSYQQVFLNYSPSTGTDDLITIAQEVPRSQTCSKVHDLILEHLTMDTVQSTSVICSKTARFFKCSLSLGVLVGRVTLVPVSLKFFPSQDALGIAVASGNFAAFGSYYVWSCLNMVDEIALSLKSDETYQTKSCEKLRKILTISFNIINGAAAQLPFFYLSWNYNRQAHWLLSFNAFDVVVPIYSMHLLFKKNIVNAAYSPAGKKVLEFKKKLIEKIDSKLQALIQAPSPSITRLFTDMDQIVDPLDKVGRFFDMLFSEQPDEIFSDNPFITDVRQKTANLIGLLLLYVQIFWCGYLCYLGMSEWTSQPELTGFACIYVIVANIALLRFVMIRSSNQLINATHRLLFTRKPYSYINERIFPKTSLIVRLAALALAACAAVPASVMSEDFMPKALILPSTITYGISLGLLNYLPTRDLLDKVSTKFLNPLANDQEKIELKVHKQLSSIKKIIQNTSPESLALFLLKNEEHPFLSYMLSRFDFTIDDLMCFLSHSRSSVSF